MLARAVGSGGAERRRRRTTTRSERSILDCFYRKLEEFYFENVQFFPDTNTTDNLPQILARAIESGGAERRRRWTATRSECSILDCFYRKYEKRC
jgi:hypothetical protein